MKIAITGGGTGGHVFPALEIARSAMEGGAEVLYLGSLRGQEGRACERSGVRFLGFPSGPVPPLTTLKGARAALQLFRCAAMAQKSLREFQPNALFSTGGYASAPVAQAARRLRLPYVIHEQNSVPGRTNRLLARDAFCVATVFKRCVTAFPDSKVERTGMPVRRELRLGAQGSLPFCGFHGEPGPVMLVMGGSQGASALNDVALATALRMRRTEALWLHVTGVSHYESTHESMSKMGVERGYAVRAFLEGADLASAYFSASLSICRSGAGTLSELAAFRKPSILVPYPSAYANHQMSNAQEFEEIGAATILSQSDLTPSALEARIHGWLSDEERIHAAECSLAEWDVPDATERILRLLRAAAGAPGLSESVQ